MGVVFIVSIMPVPLSIDDNKYGARKSPVNIDNNFPSLLISDNSCFLTSIKVFKDGKLFNL